MSNVTFFQVTVYFIFDQETHELYGCGRLIGRSKNNNKTMLMRKHMATDSPHLHAHGINWTKKLRNNTVAKSLFVVNNNVVLLTQKLILLDFEIASYGIITEKHFDVYFAITTIHLCTDIVSLR